MKDIITFVPEKCKNVSINYVYFKKNMKIADVQKLMKLRNIFLKLISAQIIQKWEI